MALSQMQFPGGRWDRYRRDLADDKKRIESARSWNALGVSGEGDDTVITEGGQDVGSSRTWHDREELRTRRYFHGSESAIPIGDYVVPGAALGRNNFPHFAEPRNRAVFMAVRPGSAHTMAEAAQDIAYENGLLSDGRPDLYVHEVEPEGIRDVHERMTPEWQARRAKVVRRWRVPGIRFKDRVEEFDPSPHEQLKLDL